jgi:hypothetical protein
MLSTKEVTLLIYGVLNLESRVLVAKSRTAIPPSPIPKENSYFIGTLSEILQGRFTLKGSGEFQVPFQVSSGNCALKVVLPREAFYVIRIRHAWAPNHEWVVSTQPESDVVTIACVDPVVTEYSLQETRTHLQPHLRTVLALSSEAEVPIENLEDQIDTERFRRMA